MSNWGPWGTHRYAIPGPWMGTFVTVHGLTTMRLACPSSKLMSGKIQTVFNSKARYRWCIKCARDVSKEYTNKIQRKPAVNLYSGVVINLGQRNEDKNKECVTRKSTVVSSTPEYIRDRRIFFSRIAFRKSQSLQLNFERLIVIFRLLCLEEGIRVMVGFNNRKREPSLPQKDTRWSRFLIIRKNVNMASNAIMWPVPKYAEVVVTNTFIACWYAYALVVIVSVILDITGNLGDIISLL